LSRPMHTQPRRAGEGSSPEPLPAPTVDGVVSAAGFSVLTVLRAVRRHLLIAGLVALFTATAAMIALRDIPHYRAAATLRLASERHQLSGGMEDAVTPIDRTTAPLLSLVPRVRSSAVIGPVVDSLKLQLRWIPLRWFGLWTEPVPAIALDSVVVSPNAAPDTLYVTFTPRLFKVQRESQVQTAAYGSPVRLGGVQFTVSKPPDMSTAVLAVGPRSHAIDQVLEELAVSPLTGTDAMELGFTDPDPALAQQVVNHLAEGFYRSTIESSQERARRRREFLAGQLTETERLLTQAQSNLVGFRRRRQVANSGEKLAMQQAALVALDTRRNDLEADRKVYVSLLQQVERKDTIGRTEALRSLVYSPEIAADPMVSRVYQQLMLYRSRLDSLTSGAWRSSETNPDVVQLKSLLASSQEELIFALRAHLKSLESRSAALAEIRTSNADSLRSMPAVEAEETYLAEQVASLGELSSQLRLEHQKARIAEELEAGDVEVVDLAALPYVPVGVPWWLKLGVALVAGLVAGAGAATLLEARNRSIRGPEELAEIIPAQGLGIIPRVEEAVGVGSDRGAFRALGNDRTRNNGLPHEVVRDSTTLSVGTEAFRLLYSSLTFGWGEHRRIMLVTSTAPQEGKTLVASNLAVTFAREGARVLLVDCDVRRPRLHKMFRFPRSPGLMDLLLTSATPATAPSQGPVIQREAPPKWHGYSFFGGIERSSEGMPEAVMRPSPSPVPPPPAVPLTQELSAWEQPRAIRATNIRGLWVLPCGTMPENPAETLRVGEVRRVLQEMAEHYDLIVIDTPPVLATGDAAILAPLADAVLLVIRAGQTEREPAERAYHQLIAAGAKVVGTVLNDPEEEIGRYRKLYYSYDYPAPAD
jgi:Mrp family chromosome partitioning ATPase/uncharacterized protein involved in exopolysaccharide biosynthesis